MKITTAIASFGMSTQVFHGPLLHFHPQFHLKTILERSSDSCLEKYPDVLVAKTFDEILADPEIELVIINTPNMLHFPMAKAALMGGKHVVVEKPFTLNYLEGKELTELALTCHRTISVFQSKRYEADFLTLKSILDLELVGTPVELHWHYDRYRSTLTYKKWKENDLPGAGVLFDLGVHLIDSTVQLFGLPKTVTCHLKILRNGAGAPDYFHLRLGYGNLDVYLHSSTYVLQKGPHITLHGKNGSFIKYSNDPQEIQLKSNISPYDDNYGQENEDAYGELVTLENNEVYSRKYQSIRGNYISYYDSLFELIKFNKSNPVPPEQAVQNLRIIEYAMQSYKEGRTIKYEF